MYFEYCVHASVLRLERKTVDAGHAGTLQLQAQKIYTGRRTAQRQNKSHKIPSLPQQALPTREPPYFHPFWGLMPAFKLLTPGLLRV